MTIPIPKSLERVHAYLGPTLLRVAAGDVDGAAAVTGVAIYDRYDDALLPPGAIVLGVGVRDSAEIAALIDEVGRAGATALIVRGPTTVDDAVRAAAGRTRVVLLELAHGASWAQIAVLLRSILTDGSSTARTLDDVADAEALGGVPSGDLFALANAVSSLVDAPLTIEDAASNVLAFSGRQESGDQSRIETILGRQVPPRYTALLREHGVFRDLYRSAGPVYIDPARLGMPAIALPRVAVAVRAGAEVIGSIWAVVSEPLSCHREQAFVDAAKLVAVHMLHQRASADVEYRVRAELVATVLEGGVGSGRAASQLGITSRLSVAVALGIRRPADNAEPAATMEELRRLADAFSLHLSAFHSGSAAALLGSVVYGIVPASAATSGPAEVAIRVVTEFLDRLGDRHDVVVGIGRPSGDVAELPRSRKDADAVLATLRAADGSPRVAQLDDVYVRILLRQLRDFIEVENYADVGPLARLREYDRRHGANHIPTLTAWLDAFGDIAAAAAALHVHPNTLRYRLRRLAEVAGIDLTSAEDRFAAMLELRLWAEATSVH